MPEPTNKSTSKSTNILQALVVPATDVRWNEISEGRTKAAAVKGQMDYSKGNVILVCRERQPFLRAEVTKSASYEAQKVPREDWIAMGYRSLTEMVQDIKCFDPPFDENSGENAVTVVYWDNARKI